MHPGGHILTHALLEGEREGTVATIATVVSQLLSGKRPLASDSLAIESDEMIDAQIVDIGIVSRALRREILTKIKTVGTNNLGKLEKGEVVLQIELRVNAMLL